MDIKNPANIQTKISPTQGADGQNAAHGASSGFLIRTMREDLEALSKNIQPTSLKLEPQIASLAQTPIYQPPAETPAKGTFLASAKPTTAKESVDSNMPNANTKQKQPAANQSYAEAVALFKNRSFSEALKKAGQIEDDTKTGWWLKRKAKKIADSSRNELTKQKAASFQTIAPQMPAGSANTAAPAPVAQPPRATPKPPAINAASTPMADLASATVKAAPPASLPIIPDSQKPVLDAAEKQNMAPKPQAPIEKPIIPQTLQAKKISSLAAPLFTTAPSATSAIQPKAPNPPIPALPKNSKSAAMPMPTPQSNTLRPQNAKFINGKTALAIGSLVAATGLLVTGGWILWQRQSQQPITSATPAPSLPTSQISTQTTTPSPSTSPTPAAKPIFSADKQEIIALKDNRENPIAQEIASRANTETPKGTFTELLFKSSSKNNFLSLIDLAAYLPTDMLGLADGTDARLKNYLNPERFSFLLYSQAPLSSSPFTGNLNKNKVVLVLALASNATSTPAKENIKRILLKNEASLQKTLAKIMPTDTPQIANAKFLTNIYKNEEIRYFNFDPAGETSIDYAVLNDMILIGTSKESMLAAIDKIIANDRD